MKASQTMLIPPLTGGNFLKILALLTVVTSASASAFDVTRISVPGGSHASLGSLIKTPGGELVLSWVERPSASAPATLKVAKRTDDWSEPVTIATGENWFVNWADFPAVAAGPNTMVAHWLEKSGESTYAYGVRQSVSKDGGATWGKPSWMHADRSPTEHGFVSYFVENDGTIAGVWLDGQNTAQGEPMTLRTGSISGSAESLVDDSVCDCCQTDAAMTPSGPVVVYRNRTGEDIRDIAVRRRDGQQWGPAVIVGEDNWHIRGCPVNGPAIAAFDNQVAVTWYTGADEQPRVQLAFADAATLEFSQPLTIAEPVLGRVDVRWLNQNEVLVSYLSETAGEVSVHLAKVRADSGAIESETVGTTGAGRAAGFPRMEVIDNNAYLVWTDTQDQAPMLQLVEVSFTDNGSTPASTAAAD